MGELDTLIQQRLDADTDFQTEIEGLSDEEKTEKIAARRSEILEEEYKSLTEKHSKSDELAKNYKTRAEKAEQELRKPKPADDGGHEPSKKTGDDLSTTDVFALMKADVHEDDVDWLKKQAKASEKPIAQIIKDEEVQAVLKLRKEKRETANAQNTKPARPGSRKADGDALKRELEKEGKVPEAGTDEAEELFWARRGGRKSKIGGVT